MCFESLLKKWPCNCVPKPLWPCRGCQYPLVGWLGMQYKIFASIQILGGGPTPKIWFVRFFLLVFNNHLIGLTVGNSSTNIFFFYYTHIFWMCYRRRSGQNWMYPH